jgi:hypothetical protein
MNVRRDYGRRGNGAETTIGLLANGGSGMGKRTQDRREAKTSNIGRVKRLGKEWVNSGVRVVTCPTSRRSRRCKLYTFCCTHRGSLEREGK